MKNIKGKRLKILFLPAWYPSSENPINGIFVREHAKAVSLYNDVVIIYDEGRDKKIKSSYKIISDKNEDGIRTIGIKHRKSPIPKTTYFVYLWAIFDVFRRLVREGWKPDIIHAHIFSAGVPAIILGKIYKIPVAITEHWTGFPLHKLTKIDIIKAKFAMNKANIILPVSDDLRKNIQSYGIHNRFQVVPNVANFDVFHPALNIGNKYIKKRILLVALLSPQKGLPYLLRALAKLKEKRQDFVLDVVGDGPNRNEYEALTEKLELGEMVKFHGLKSKPEVAEYMMQCDFFVQSSLFETFGVTFVEAMACGKPIVATQLPVLQDKINEDRGILVSPKDVKALEKAIDYMLDHYHDYSPENISQYAKDNFSYEVIGGKLDRIYKKIVYRVKK